MSKFQICVVGSGSFDLFLCVPHFPQEGETIQTHDSFIKNGGKGANQAVAASKLGVKTTFAGQFGIDKYGDNLVKEMSDFGVNLDYLRRIGEEQTGQAIIMLNDKGENSIIIVGGTNMYYPDKSQLPEQFQQAILQSRLLQLQKEIPIEITTLSAQLAQKNNKLVMLDCGGRDDEIPTELLQNLTFISPNETELSRVIKVNLNEEKLDIELIRQKLLIQYPNLTIVLKLGSKGSAILTKDDYYECQAVTQINPKILDDYKIIDTTGAGDCFTSAFCVRYCELVNEGQQYGKDELNSIMQKCLLFANASAFVCITVMGAMPSQPLRKDVDFLLEKYLQ